MFLHRRRFGCGRGEPAYLAFEGGDAVLEAFQNQPCVGGEDGALGAVMARGGAAGDGILEFLAARAAGARALAGGQWCRHGRFKVCGLSRYLAFVENENHLAPLKNAS